MFELGQYLEKHNAYLAGFYDPNFYLTLIKWRKIDMYPWDEQYPNWRKKPVFLLWFKEPVRPLSDDEISKMFSVAKEALNESLRDALAPKQEHMALPYDAVFGGQDDRVNDSAG